MTERVLLGRRYLIVEDEYLVASDLLDTLEGAGATVYGPVSDVRHAMEVLAEPSFVLDAAILDINLRGDMVYPVATLLMKRGMPFLFATGYQRSLIPAEFSNAPCLSKPVSDAVLIATLQKLASTSS